MKKIGLLAGLMAVLASALPVLAQDAPPRIVIEVSNQAPVVMDSIDVTVRVYDPDEPSRLVDPIDPDSLIEMRDPSGAYLPTRSAMARVDEGTYTTRFDLFHEETWQLIALPDVSDRTLLPARSTPQVTLEVRSETSPGEDSINRAGTIAFLALIAGGVIIAMLAGPWLRRPKGQPKERSLLRELQLRPSSGPSFRGRYRLLAASSRLPHRAEPTGHDTWWASP